MRSSDATTVVVNPMKVDLDEVRETLTEAARAADGVLRHERLFAAVEQGDVQTILKALNDHGARTYLT